MQKKIFSLNSRINFFGANFLALPLQIWEDCFRDSKIAIYTVSSTLRFFGFKPIWSITFCKSLQTAWRFSTV